MQINWKNISRVAKPSKITKLVPIFDKVNANKKVLIKVKNLKQVFGKNLIYKNVNFNINQGETLALLGCNGAGKTTLVETIAGITKQTSGEVQFLYNVKGKGHAVGVQFQDLSLPNGVSIKDIIQFVVALYEGDDLETKIVDEMLEKFRLKEFLHLQAKKLSGGQQQRLNVMIALLSKPKVLFLDEFTTGLDIDVKNKIKDYILDFTKKNNISIVLISHDVDMITEMSDRILILAEKTLLVDATCTTLVEKFGSISEFLKRYII